MCLSVCLSVCLSAHLHVLLIRRLLFILQLLQRGLLAPVLLLQPAPAKQVVGGGFVTLEGKSGCCAEVCRPRSRRTENEKEGRQGGAYC